MTKTPLIYTHIGNRTTIAISGSFDIVSRQWELDRPSLMWLKMVSGKLEMARAEPVLTDTAKLATDNIGSGEDKPSAWARISFSVSSKDESSKIGELTLWSWISCQVRRLVGFGWNFFECEVSKRECQEGNGYLRHQWILVSTSYKLSHLYWS
jgi:hypothetical protein